MNTILNGYRLMWLMVMFDLPVVEAEDRRIATKFRDFLEKEGFGMCQYSVYAKYCGPREKMESIYRRIEAKVPDKGKVNILCFTDKQFANIVIYENNKRRSHKENPDQYVLFEDILD